MKTRCPMVAVPVLRDSPGTFINDSIDNELQQRMENSSGKVTVPPARGAWNLKLSNDGFCSLKQLLYLARPLFTL